MANTHKLSQGEYEDDESNDSQDLFPRIQVQSATETSHESYLFFSFQEMYMKLSVRCLSDQNSLAKESMASSHKLSQGEIDDDESNDSQNLFPRIQMKSALDTSQLPQQAGVDELQNLKDNDKNESSDSENLFPPIQAKSAGERSQEPQPLPALPDKLRNLKNDVKDDESSDSDDLFPQIEMQNPASTPQKQIIIPTSQPQHNPINSASNASFNSGNQSPSAAVNADIDQHQYVKASKDRKRSQYACIMVIIAGFLLLYSTIGVTYLLLASSSNCACTSAVEQSRSETENIYFTTFTPSSMPTEPPLTLIPSSHPTETPSFHPTQIPTQRPTTFQYTSSPTLEPTIEPTTEPTNEPTYEPTFEPTPEPTFEPTFEPTEEPTSEPIFQVTNTSTTIGPTGIPTNEPTYFPSEDPTFSPTFYSLYGHYIGDFKISAHTESHGNWLLCDGSFIDPSDYPQLFDIIGYSFGSSSSLFALPDASDRVIGVNGNSYSMGTITGNEDISLSEDNLPSHWHYVAQSGTCSGTSFSATDRPYLSTECYDHPATSYVLGAKPGEPDRFHTGSTGSTSSFNIMQPTVFVGNLFVFAD